jgi:tetratricopeptide (TPR) repeat protein
LLLSVILWPSSGQAFRKVALGDEVPNIELKTLDGKARTLFRTDTKINVFVFFRPSQEYSRTCLVTLAQICNAYLKRQVRCVAIVSEYFSKNEIKAAIKATGWPSTNTFVDKEDLYTDTLGVILYPTVGIADGTRKLHAYEPFTKVNFGQRIEAKVRFLLGDISDKQLQSALAPPVQEEPAGNCDTARINFNFAKRLYDAGKPDKALSQAERALSLDPKLADAYALIGVIRASQRQCDAAKLQFQKALALDKNNAQAKKGMALCK